MLKIAPTRSESLPSAKLALPFGGQKWPSPNCCANSERVLNYSDQVLDHTGTAGDGELAQPACPFHRKEKGSLSFRCTLTWLVFICPTQRPATHAAAYLDKLRRDSQPKMLSVRPHLIVAAPQTLCAGAPAKSNNATMAPFCAICRVCRLHKLHHSI